MSLRAVDVHGFAGGFTLGTVQAGFELVGKMSSSAGFGVFNTLANRHLLGENWDSIVGDPKNWEVIPADFVFGNPPCSGFSTLSNKNFRGMDSKINEYMWELIRYAGRVAPPIVAWESVQGTFNQGLPLMRQLHAELEEISGHKYTLYHVLHNNLSHGGISMRKRYFWVASRIPFGVEKGRVTRQGEIMPLDRVPVFGDMLDDLATLGLTWRPQRYRSIKEERMYDDEGNIVTRTKVLNGSWWSEREAHDGTGFVDGHDTFHTNRTDLVLNLLTIEGARWDQGDTVSNVLRRYYNEHGHLPKGWQFTTKVKNKETGEVTLMSKEERLVQTDFHMGHSQPYRWRAYRPAQVITGGAIRGVVHPYLPRFLTHRECARVQGFPDDWQLFNVRNAPDVGPGWGKGVPVQAGRWIARWARAALEGTPGTMTGVPLEQYDRRKARQFGTHDREFIINTTYAYREALTGDERFD